MEASICETFRSQWIKFSSRVNTRKWIAIAETSPISMIIIMGNLNYRYIIIIP